jgi:hypothetical protein
MLALNTKSININIIASFTSIASGGVASFGDRTTLEEASVRLPRSYWRILSGARMYKHDTKHTIP